MLKQLSIALLVVLSAAICGCRGGSGIGQEDTLSLDEFKKQWRAAPTEHMWINEKVGLPAGLYTQSDSRVFSQKVPENAAELTVFYPPDFDFKGSLPCVVTFDFGEQNSFLKKHTFMSPSDEFHTADSLALFSEAGFAAVFLKAPNVMSNILATFDYLNEHAEELHLDTSRVALHAANHQIDRSFFLLSSKDFALALGVEAVSLWVGQELLGFLYSHHQALTKYAPAEPLALSVAIGAGGDDPMIAKSVSFFERLQDEGHEVSILHHAGGTEFFEPEHETNAAATKEIIQEQVVFLQNQLLE